MSLFENRKCSGMVLTGVFLGTGVISAVNQGVVGAVLQGSVADAKGVKNSSSTLLNFLKNHWGWFLVALGLIAVVGVIFYKIVSNEESDNRTAAEKNDADNSKIKDKVVNSNIFENNIIEEEKRRKEELKSAVKKIVDDENVTLKEQYKGLPEYFGNVFLEFDEIRQYTNIESLALSLSAHYNKDYTEMYMTIQKVLSSAFNTKYGSYSYENDTRSVDKSWHERFQNILCSVVNSPLHTIKIIDVGVGSGHEAIKLFSDYDNVTFIDIARDGLRIIESQMPKSKTYMLNAEQLTNISSSTYDLYVSLRTYNSSFFDIVKALNEAFRVLKEDGKIIISIANGFLRIENKTIIPGLIIPRTDFVDIYRGVNIAKNIRNIMQQIGFYKINIIPSEAEIYITAKKDN